MFGSHLSIAGGLHNALLDANRLGMDCVQIFTKNQRQWRVKPLTDEQVTLWRQHRSETGIEHVVSHDSYLINLASPDDAARKKSINLFREELLRCEALEIPYLVTHPGAHMKEGEPAGIQRVADSLNQLHEELTGLRVVTCLEITAGQGTTLGWQFEHLRDIIAATRQPQRLGVCLDTAHLLAAGYDLTSAAGCRAVLRECDQVIGLERVKVLHLNDSKTPLGSRVDRHEHIGQGHVSLEAFAVIVKNRKFRLVPKILETPKQVAPDGRQWDEINLEVLKRMTGPKPESGAKRRVGRSG